MTRARGTWDHGIITERPFAVQYGDRRFGPKTREVVGPGSHFKVLDRQHEGLLDQVHCAGSGPVSMRVIGPGEWVHDMRSHWTS